MYSVLIDTSTEKCFVAFAKDAEIIFHSDIPPSLQAAQAILPELQRGLQVLNLTMKECSFVCVTVGPGSYTGIRVGVTAAKTIAFACGIPLIGICSLNLFVPQDVTAVNRFAAVIDAKIGGLYIQEAQVAEGIIKRSSPPSVYSLSEAAELLSADTLIVSPNFTRWRSQLEHLAGEISWKWEEGSPSAQQMLTLALEKYQTKEYPLDGKLELLYMRKTQAEIEKETKQKANKVSNSP